MFGLFENIHSPLFITLPVVIERIMLSLLLGGAIGFERQSKYRDAGLRTFTLICLGSTLAMLLSIWVPTHNASASPGDPARIAAQVLSGIGFLGAGAILQTRGSISGLTTAAGIWISAVIGLAVGAGLYIPAIIITAVVLAVLVLLEDIERKTLLGGRNKILELHFNTSKPDLDPIRELLKENRISIISVSIRYSFVNNRAVYNFHVRIPSRTLMDVFFGKLRENEAITEAKLMD